MPGRAGDLADRRCLCALATVRRGSVWAVRAVVPDTMPVLVRISGTDWVDGGCYLEQSSRLAGLLHDHGVD